MSTFLRKNIRFRKWRCKGPCCNKTLGFFRRGFSQTKLAYGNKRKNSRISATYLTNAHMNFSPILNFDKAGVNKLHIRLAYIMSEVT